MDDAPDTVTAAVRLLEQEGYATDFSLVGDEVSCAACGERHPAAGAVIERVHRFEGDTDPADEAIVLGLRCPVCGARGVLVSAFGPDAEPGLADLIRAEGGS
jgi:hypothetical protein